MFRHEDPNHYKARWVSKAVVEMLRPDLVRTSSGTTYVLEGVMSPEHAFKKKLPKFMITAFKVKKIITFA